MSKIGQAAGFACRLYAQRARIAWAGYVRRDPMARLHLRPGRDDPYAIYDKIRAEHGTLMRTRMGFWATPSHRVCNLVLRDRRFGVQPIEDERGRTEDSELSFLELNPPDHTRLRRLAQPSFSPRAVATYRGRIEQTVGRLLDQAATAGEVDPG